MFENMLSLYIIHACYHGDIPTCRLPCMHLSLVQFLKAKTPWLSYVGHVWDTCGTRVAPGLINIQKFRTVLLKLFLCGSLLRKNYAGSGKFTLGVKKMFTSRPAYFIFSIFCLPVLVP